MAKTPTLRPAARSLHAPTATAASASKTPTLDKLRKAEHELASIKDSDPNAKFNLARLRAQLQFQDTNDTEYWVCFCFESRAQKDQFLEQTGLMRPDEDKYFNGLELADRLGLTLTRDHTPFHTLQVNRRWKRFAMPKEGPATPSPAAQSRPPRTRRT